MERDIIYRLRDCELFAALSEPDLETIAAACEKESFEAPQVIFTQGERATRLYAVVSGQVALQRVLREPGMMASITVDILGKGRVIGWPAVVEPHYHPLSAIALSPVEALAVDGIRLRHILEEDTQLGFQVLREFSRILALRVVLGYQAIESQAITSPFSNYERRHHERAKFQ